MRLRLLKQVSSEVVSWGGRFHLHMQAFARDSCERLLIYDTVPPLHQRLVIVKNANEDDEKFAFVSGDPKMPGSV